jgi:hypothetical protein
MVVVRLVRARREDQAVIRDLAAPTERVDGEAAGVNVDRSTSPSIALALRWRRSTSRIGGTMSPSARIPVAI